MSGRSVNGFIGNRYRLIRRLGVGGMGEVYAARDERLERDVAVKKLTFFSGTLEQLETFTQRFKREAVSMAQFVHPYIVPVYDFGEEDGSLYLVMGLMSGGSLKEKMGQPISPITAIKTILPIASALSYVHENGVIHRDVKPANILFNQRGTPMLADFGIVKLMESEGVTLTAAGTGVGTPAYMAPEQVTNDLDHRIDQYSLGVILYELITGKKPFSGDTPVMTLIAHRTEPLPDPRQYVPDLSDEVCAVLKKTLAKDRDERYADMDEFEAALRQLIADESTSSIPNIKDLVEDVGQDLAEEALEEGVDQMVEKAREQWEEVDPDAATQLSEAPAVEEPVEVIVDEDAPTQLTSQPAVEEPAAAAAPEEPLDEGATRIASQEIEVEEDATAIASQPVAEADATAIAPAEEVSSSATELPQPTGKNLIDMIDGATVFRHKGDDDAADILESGPTELLEGMPDAGPTEILDTEGGPTELLDMGEEATELLEVETTPAAPEKPVLEPPPLSFKTPGKKFPIWTLPVALIVVGGLIVGLLAILGVGPFAPEPTPTIEYNTYDFENEEEEEPEPEPEEEEPVVVVAADNEVSICAWDNSIPLMEHLLGAFTEANPDVNTRLEAWNVECKPAALNGEIDFAQEALTEDEREQYPEAIEFQVGYSPAIFNIHRELGIEYINSGDLIAIFRGEINNWAEVGGPDAEITVVTAEITPPWAYVNWAMLEGSGWRDDVVYMGNLDEVNAFVDENWNAIAITGTRKEPDHIIAVGVDAIPTTGITLMRGLYPLMWQNQLTINKNWDQMSDAEHRFVDFIYSDEGWDIFWEEGFVPWDNTGEDSEMPENGRLSIAGSTLMADTMFETIARFMEQNPSWEIYYDPVGGQPSFDALVNGEVDVSLNGCTLGDSLEDCESYMNGMTSTLIAYLPAFFWNHQDIDVWGLGRKEFQAILNGNATNWSQVGGPDEEIVIVIPQDQAPYYIIQDAFFDWEELPDYIVRVANYDEVVAYIEENPNALGVGGLHDTPEFIHWMRINEVEINEDTLRSGEYPLRWIYLYLTDGPPDEFEQAFLDYIFSEEGVQVRWDTGVIPPW